jgi:dTMP kinase
MDLRLAHDPYESFRIFQGRMLERYLSMTDEFRFVTVDANQPIEVQQSFVRETVVSRLNLSTFLRTKIQAS